MTYSNSSDNPSTAARTVSYSVNDGVLGSNVTNSTITVSRVNDAPVLSPGNPSLKAVDEDDTNSDGTRVADFVINGSITDIDNSPIEAIYISYVDTANGRWEFRLSGSNNWIPILLSNNQGLLLDSNDDVRFIFAIS